MAGVGAPQGQFWGQEETVNIEDPLAFAGHQDAISRIALSADQTVLMAGDIQGRVMAWDVGTRSGRIAPFRDPSWAPDRPWVTDLLSAANGYLFVRFGSGQVIAIDIRKDSWTRLACETSGSRDLRADGARVVSLCN